MIPPRDRLIFALDVPTGNAAFNGLAVTVTRSD